MPDLAERRDQEISVYQPAEDSHLLARATASQVTGDECILEVGCGSGIVAAYLRAETGATVIASDINPFACQATADRGIPVVRGDLVTPFAAEKFDVVVFNPPYLPADSGTPNDDWMEIALTGGPNGRAVLTRFLETVNRVLTGDGTVFVLVSTVTGVESVVETAATNGFSAVAIADESYPFETLTVLKLLR